MAQEQAKDYSKYSSKDLLQMNVRTERLETVPISVITEEESLVDSLHATELAESMMGDRKQISPATIRARLNGTFIVYDMIDGFHRQKGKKIIEQITGVPQFLDSTVLYGCDDEELYDLRVLAANSVKSVKFARMAEWMKKSFESTVWKNGRISELISSEKITLSQVFTFTHFNKGKVRGLNVAEADELKEWAFKKSKQWKKPLSSLIFDMRTVELAAPDLVQRVRTGGGGKDRKGVLTKARLDKIVEHLFGEYEAQRNLANLSIDKNIVAEDLGILSKIYRIAIESNDKETITKLLNEPELFLIKLIEDKSNGKQKEPQKTSRFSKNNNHLSSSKIINYQLSSAEENFFSNSEHDILRKNGIPEIFDVLISQLCSQENGKIVILDLQSSGRVLLNPTTLTINNNGASIGLTSTECKLMEVFLLLEGMTISDALLTVILDQTNISLLHPTFDSLKRKIELISVDAAKELKKDKNKYGWLVE